MTKSLTTSLGQQIVDRLKAGGGQDVRAQQALSHLNQAMNVLRASLDDATARDPYDLLAEIGAVLWPLDAAWKMVAAG